MEPSASVLLNQVDYLRTTETAKCSRRPCAVYADDGPDPCGKTVWLAQGLMSHRDVGHVSEVLLSDGEWHRVADGSFERDSYEYVRGC